MLTLSVLIKSSDNLNCKTEKLIIFNAYHFKFIKTSKT